MQRQRTVGVEISEADRPAKPLIFKSYSVDDDSYTVSIPKISLTQPLVVTDPKVKIPEIYIPDPIEINPNLIANVEKVLSYRNNINTYLIQIMELITIVV